VRLRRDGYGSIPVVPKSKKPKVKIKREKTSLGWAYRI